VLPEQRSGTVWSHIKAVPPLLWFGKDREVWFFPQKNREKVDRFPDFLPRSTGREQ
jgi:hypothetical protein